MKRIINILIGCLMVWTFSGCEDPYLDETFTAFEELPIGTTIASWEDYSDWVKLLKKADLYNAINVGEKFTCFCANNEAVAEYVKYIGRQSVDEITEAEAADLMKYHIISGMAYDLLAFTGKVGTQTLSLDNLDIKAYPGGYYVNQYAKIIDRQYKPLNGSLYRLDKVLRPLTSTVWNLLETDRYKIFSEAMLACGLKDTLNRKEDEINEVVFRDYKTVFAVSDSVFAENNIRSLDQLKAIYSDQPAADGISPLYRFMAYHIVPGILDWATIADYDSKANPRVKVLQTFAPNELISVADVKGRLVFNQTDSKPAVLIDGRYDQLANNGYVHEISELLPTCQAEACFFNWELSDYKVFRILNNYKAWSSAVDQSEQPINREAAEKEGITWKTVPDTDEAVFYYLRSLQYFQDNDAVTFKLGNVGWVEMKTPVFPAGKYEMWAKAQKYNGRGKGRLMLDGNILEDRDFASGGAETNGYKIKEITFTEQVSHTFRLTALRSGAINLDQFYFKPIK